MGTRYRGLVVRDLMLHVRVVMTAVIRRRPEVIGAHP
jgi:hypothetical protein